ncbi:MAG: pyruvate, water dikinase regulatory protein [Pseudobdellovibrionaceae bacterium]
MRKATSKNFHLHLVSDSTGQTLQGLAKAALAQFSDITPIERYWPLVRTSRQLDRVLKEIDKNPGPIFFTFVDPNLRKQLKAHCQEADLPCLAVLDPILRTLSSYTGKHAAGIPGAQHAMDEDYFKRIDAIDFALGFDDGQNLNGIEDAEVILVGVSRTSKTPTCVYLARRGVRAGNIPFVPHVPFPEHVLALKKPLFVGLTENPDRLIQLRSSRLKVDLAQQTMFGNAYLDPEAVEEEVKTARRFFKEQGWPIIDVTKRSIEETAAEILFLLQKRQKFPRESA